MYFFRLIRVHPRVPQVRRDFRGRGLGCGSPPTNDCPARVGSPAPRATGNRNRPATAHCGSPPRGKTPNAGLPVRDQPVERRKLNCGMSQAATTHEAATNTRRQHPPTAHPPQDIRQLGGIDHPRGITHSAMPPANSPLRPAVAPARSISLIRCLPAHPPAFPDQHAAEYGVLYCRGSQSASHADRPPRFSSLPNFQDLHRFRRRIFLLGCSSPPPAEYLVPFHQIRSQRRDRRQYRHDRLFRTTCARRHLLLVLHQHPPAWNSRSLSFPSRSISNPCCNVCRPAPAGPSQPRRDASISEVFPARSNHRFQYG